MSATWDRSGRFVFAASVPAVATVAKKEALSEAGTPAPWMRARPARILEPHAPQAALKLDARRVEEATHSLDCQVRKLEEIGARLRFMLREIHDLSPKKRKS